MDLSLETLGELDHGAARAVIDAALKAAINDLDDRGEDKAKRVITIEVAMKKLANGTVDVAVTCKSKVPAYQTHSTFGKLASRPKGQVAVAFEEISPRNPSQPALPIVREDRDEETA